MSIAQVPTVRYIYADFVFTRVVYYNALYFGLQQIRGPDPIAQGMYLKLLEAVPAWLDTTTYTEMDGHTAALTAWTAIDNHDYQLSWKFHCKSCHYIKTKKIDQLDVVPARTFEEESERDSARFLYWHILSTDILFRLFYGKPTVVCVTQYHETTCLSTLFLITVGVRILIYNRCAGCLTK